MNKIDIDKWFSDNERKVKDIIQYYKYKHSRHFNKDDMFSDVYIYICDFNDKNTTSSDGADGIDCISFLEQIVFNYIKKNSLWLSGIVRDYKTNKEYLTQDASCDLGEYIVMNDNEGDLRNKVLIEKRIDILYDFRNTLTDLEERLFFTRYIDLLHDGIKPTVRKMMSEFDTKLNITHVLLKDLLLRLNNYIEKNNYKDE